MFEDCPVKIQQSEEELSWLFEKLHELKPENIIEIGRLQGGTLWNWLKLNPKVVVSVDINSPTENEIKKFTFWAGNTEIKLVTGKSQEPQIVCKVKKEIELADFIFIDGDHHEHQVEHDWYAYWPLLMSGGIMAFHDIAPNPSEHCTVHKFWKRLKESGLKTDEIIKSTMGIGVAYKCS
jgi:cephalosporin hydroxylase